MKHLKAFTSLSENVKYHIDPDKYFDENEQRVSADYFIGIVESASGRKVLEIEGEISETECDVLYILEDGIEISHKYIFHPYAGQLDVSLEHDGKNFRKSVGSLPKIGSMLGTNKSENPEYSDLEYDQQIFNMVKDILTEAGLLDYNNVVKLPKVPYEINDEGEIEILFFSEEEAKAWIKSICKDAKVDKL